MTATKHLPIHDTAIASIGKLVKFERQFPVEMEVMR